MNKTLAAIVLVSVFGGVGCTSEGPPPSGRADKLAPGQYPQIVPLEGLARVLRFSAPIVERAEPGRPMRVSVPTRNIGGRELNVQYRFSFLDRGGRPLGTNQGWAYTKLIGNGVETTLEANSLEDTADDWRLELRPAR